MARAPLSRKKVQALKDMLNDGDDVAAKCKYCGKRYTYYRGACERARCILNSMRDNG